MSVTDKLISLGTKIDAAKTHCNEALIAKGGTEASTLWDVGDRIGELSGSNQQLIDLIERDIVEIEIPDDVTKIGLHAFAYCSSLTSLTLPDSVTSIGQMAFEYCTSLTEIIIPDNVESIGMYAFSSCTALASVTIPTSVSTIRTGVFSDCDALTELILPKTNYVISLESILAIRSTPIGSGTGYIYVPQALLSEYQSATNWSTFSAQFRAIEDYPDIVGG